MSGQEPTGLRVEPITDSLQTISSGTAATVALYAVAVGAVLLGVAILAAYLPEPEVRDTSTMWALGLGLGALVVGIVFYAIAHFSKAL